MVSEFRKISLKSSKFVPENYLSTLYKLSEKECIVDFLKSIRNDENRLNEISSQSYLHQNGFNKLILSSNFDLGWRLRMHIWQTNYCNNDLDIHNHSWNYASVIVLGKLTNEIYRVSKDGENYYHHIYTIDNIKSESSLKVVGVENLIIDNSITYKARDIYYQTQDKLHRTFPSGKKPTVTIVVQQKGKGNFSDVYKKRQQNYSKFIGHTGTLIEVNQIKHSIDTILKEI